MRLPLVLVGLPILWVAAAGGGIGLSTCRCKEWEPRLEQYVQGGQLIYRPTGSGAEHVYPPDYGFVSCERWDEGLAPSCDSASPPSWCADEWCYIDKAACTGAVYMDSHYFPAAGLSFSYSTCGTVNRFGAWLEANTSKPLMKRLLDNLETNLWSAVRQLETSHTLLPMPVTSGCEHNRLCDCGTCEFDSHWDKRVNFHEAGLWIRTADALVSQEDRNLMSCLSRSIADIYRKIAGSEMTSAEDLQRVGYLYFGDQGTGSIIQWPLMQWCPHIENSPDWDSRRRPWYSVGATGPKDLVIIIDVSGSMGQPDSSPRWRLARSAALALLDTLSWKDWAQIVLFSDRITKYGGSLQSMTSANRARMRDWVAGLPEDAWHRGGTYYRMAVDAAFEIFSDSTSAGASSYCQKAVMLLTDGVASPGWWTASDAWSVSQRTKKESHDGNGEISFFTYALGDALTDSGKATLKSIACDNGGIYYEVPDQVGSNSGPGQLTAIMTQYFDFFAYGQELCYPSYVRFADAITGTQLYTGCMPMYDRNNSLRSVLGVNCMDASMLGSMDDMKSDADWDHFICKISDVTKKCASSLLSECNREQIRRKVSAGSVCNPQVQAENCGCDPAPCEDDDNWMDSKGYFCDSWVADDCHDFSPGSRAVRIWGYDPSEQAAILANCRKSCQNCGPNPPCRRETCPAPSLSTAPCRACSSAKGVSGVDIEGCPMACPGMRACPAATAEASPAGADGGFGIGLVIGLALGGAVVLAIVAAFFLWKQRPAPPARAPVHHVTPAIVSTPPPRRSLGGHTPQPVPSYWENQQWETQAFDKLVQCPAMIPTFQTMLDDTFKMISTSDRRGGPMPERLVVNSVMRIENRNLWAQYREGCSAVRSKRSHSVTPFDRLARGGAAATMQVAPVEFTRDLDHRINETLLWHGTSPQGAQGIKGQGFSMNRAGTNAGCMYGPGIYLAENSSKSDEYATDDREGLYQGLYCLLLCRAVLGEVLQMTSGGSAVHKTIAEAVKSGTYDSVLGDRASAVGTYREFVVYQESQCYPEYVVIYRREFS